MNGIAVRRDIADLILEALDIAGSRNLTGPAVQALVLDVLAAERPDIPSDHAQRLIERCRVRLNGRASLLAAAQGIAFPAADRAAE